MITWKEKRKRIVLDLDSARPLSGNVEELNTCENCMEEIDCEDCDVSINVICDYTVEEVEIEKAQMTLCGIPVGYPYELKK